MLRYAVVDWLNTVVNVIIRGGDDDGGGYLECIEIRLNENERCAPNWTYDPNANPRFIEPQPEV
jgi:hypothetical protein